MDTLVRVQIICREHELRSMAAFSRAAEFGKYDADIDIICLDTKQSRSYSCSSSQIRYSGWLFFRDGWERQFGKLNP
jgi:hypothetical protein